MSFSEILVHLDHSRAYPGRLQWSIQLATRLDARLVGCYVVPSIYLPVLPDGASPADLIAAEEVSIESDRRAAEEGFAQATASLAIETRWQSGHGDLAEGLTQAARYAELCVVGQHEPGDPRTPSAGLFEHVLLGSGRPVLLAPYGPAPASTAEHVLIAWNASPQAARAVHDALPLLRRAETVQVARFDAGHEDPEAEDPAARLCEHLAGHGIEARAHREAAPDEEVGTRLLDLAERLGCDLLVMGGYGHSRFRELVLGGATREIVRESPIPVLMSH